MRCQCGFNSFDHHLVCPKCHKDLTPTRRLLNLDVPAPGRVNFFQSAGQGTVGPPPFPGSGEVSEGHPGGLRPGPPFPDAAVEGEDFEEDLRPLEDIRPITYGAKPSPPRAGAQAWPGIKAYGAAAPEITPAAPQAFADPAEAPMFEIEMADDFEVDRPRAAANSAPHPHVFMGQIKTALTETGDLNPETGPSVPGGREKTPAARASKPAGASGEDDDLSSLLGDLNLDELDRDL